MTIEELLARPDLVQTLSPTERAAMLLQSAAASCLLATGVTLARVGIGEDRTLSTKEAAAMLGVSASTLRHNAHTTYASCRVENGTHRLAFSSLAITRFLKR